jgi:hypothetical protein
MIKLNYDIVGGIFMKKVYDIAVILVLLLLLIAGYFIDNAVVRGVFLLLFSAALIASTVIRLGTKMKGGFGRKFLYGVLLFLELILAISASYVIVTAVIGA